ncbi:TetR/AcrR family transcriptional regulator [Geodermatophilus sp. SYSU D00814]
MAEDRRLAGAPETRARIERAAVELFRRHGYEAVTVGEVCRAADVSPATFYRHFRSKEDVVVGYREPFSAALTRAVASVEADVPGRDRLPAVLLAFADFLESQQELLDLQGELVDGHPALLRRTLAVQQQLEAQLAAALAARGGTAGPADADLAAAVGLAVLRAAVCHRRSGGSPSMPAAMRRALAEARRMLG